MSRKYLFRVFSLIGLLSVIFSAFVLPPIVVSLWFQDGEVWHLLLAMLAMLALGLLLWLPFRQRQVVLRRREGFLIVALFWLLLGVVGAIPFEMALHTRFIDSLFEAVSGLTTTGATVLQGLDAMQPSILFYRQELQWVGGMGLVVFALALLPMLGIGGVALYRAELAGPIKDDKLAPSLYKGVRTVWYIYIGLTLACALAYWLAGMSGFDAIAHSLATVSTGGFSTHDASIGYFHSFAIEEIALVFMLLGAVNFTVHYLVLHHRDPRLYWRNFEVRAFLRFVFVVSVVVAVALWVLGYYHSLGQSLRYASFEVVSVITSTGFAGDDFSIWPLSLPVLLLFAGFIGGCGGSTSGGMKMLRVQVLLRLASREVRRLLHPTGVFPVMLEQRTIPERLMQGMLGFFSIYVTSFVLLMLLMMASGVDQVTAFSAIATCINNIGPGLGEITTTFGTLNDSAKVIAIATMLLGRLEVLTVMVVLHPHFWLK